MSHYKIYLLRHLETENNLRKVISGQGDAELTRRDYPPILLGDIAKVYCSPAKRCVQTVQILLGDNYQITCDDRLSERNLGFLEGMEKKKARTLYPDLFINNHFDVFKTPEGGESYPEFYQRLHSFYLDAIKPAQENIIICSHNQSLKLLMSIITKQEMTYRYWERADFGNGEVREVIYTEKL